MNVVGVKKKNHPALMAYFSFPFFVFILIAAVVEDFPPDLSQPTNLLVTLFTYSSIALQNTKGKVK